MGATVAVVDAPSTGMTMFCVILTELVMSSFSPGPLGRMLASMSLISNGDVFFGLLGDNEVDDGVVARYGRCADPDEFAAVMVEGVHAAERLFGLVKFCGAAAADL